MNVDIYLTQISVKDILTNLKYLPTKYREEEFFDLLYQIDVFFIKVDEYEF